MFGHQAIRAALFDRTEAEAASYKDGDATNGGRTIARGPGGNEVRAVARSSGSLHCRSTCQGGEVVLLDQNHIGRDELVL